MILNHQYGCLKKRLDLRNADFGANVALEWFLWEKIKKWTQRYFFFVFFENSFVFLKMAATAEIDQEKLETFLSAYIGNTKP